MKIMKPIASERTPVEAEQFLYEIKYDGFRAQLVWEKDNIQIMSRNNKDLTSGFPEIVAFCRRVTEWVSRFLPMTLDGELVILNNEYEANFSLIQWRGRLRNKDKINAASEKRPASFLAFDLIKQNGHDVTGWSYTERKKALHLLMDAMLSNETQHVIDLVKAYDNQEAIWQVVADYRCEGIVAKRNTSKYEVGERHHDWFKIKNWRTIRCFLTFYDPNNGYFSGCIFNNGKIVPVGKCKHGLSDEAKETLTKLFVTNGKQVANGYELPPAICAEIHTLDLYDSEFREPKFAQLLPNQKPEECSYDQMQMDLAMMPESVSLSNTDKVFWPDVSLTKGDLLVYLRLIYPYIIPFLRDRVLTLIRCPDGVDEEFFYQKSLPSYAPEFMKEIDEEEIICNDVDALIWLGNHGTIEFHVPFQLAKQAFPAEIVFDLDPPDRGKFQLAVDAALLIKRLIDNFDLTSFVKTSGNKGIQIHIPLPTGSMTYDDTAIFTEAIATTLVREHPALFTIERMKKNRGNRLYIDYVQHGKGKTIIAPYSPRKTKEGTVATPLFWHELTNELTPGLFTITNVVERVQTLGCPFAHYHEVGERQNIEQLLRLIRN